MYHMKTIIPIEENITLPQCMYYLKNPNNNLKIDEVDINISDQVKRFLKGSPNNTMVELEHRQTQLLKKLDVLYERVKAIRNLCALNVSSSMVPAKAESVRPFRPNCIITNSKDIVIVLNPDLVPYFLNIFLRGKQGLNVTWHIHSSVPSNKALKIKEYFKSKEELYPAAFNADINIRLIFKCVSASAELRLSSLEVPLLGIVNVLRYLCLLYQNVIEYKQDDIVMDNLLDKCHLLEKIKDKQREEVLSSLFSQSKSWIIEDNLSVVDLAAFIIIKWQNMTKSVPKSWYTKCDKIFM